MALFFLLLIFIFLPLKLTFCSIFDLNSKTLSTKVKFYNLILIFNKQYKLKKLKLVDKNGKQVKVLKSGKKINVKSAFQLKKVYVVFICNLYADKYYFDTIFNIFDGLYNFFDENYRFYLKNHPKLKIIATEGIIYTSIAKIIITIVFYFGVSLWKVVKTKLKKS